jgi:hypothetical protein
MVRAEDLLPRKLDPAPGAKVEFVFDCLDRTTKEPFPLFIVEAADEAEARKIADRKYLEVVRVEPYVGQEGVEKPKTYRYGPPSSGSDFEREYHHRQPERERRARGADSVGTLEVIICLLFPCPGLIWAIVRLANGGKSGYIMMGLSLVGFVAALLLRLMIMVGRGVDW